jgi:hypothetical protein
MPCNRGIQRGDQGAGIDVRLRVNACGGTGHDVTEMIDAGAGRSQAGGLEGSQHRGRRHGAHSADLQVRPIRDLESTVPALLGEMRHNTALVTRQ